MPDFHLLDLIYLDAHPIKLFFEVILLHLKLHGVFEHKFMELFRRHPINRGFFGGIFVIVLAFDDSLVFVLIVNEFEIVLTCGIELDWSVLAHFGNLSDEFAFLSVL